MIQSSFPHQLSTVSQRVPASIAVFFACDLFLVCAYAANQLAGAPFWFPTHLLDLDGEQTVPEWYSSMQLFMGGFLLCGLAWHVGSHVRDRVKAYLLAAVLFGLSLDESVAIHEWLGDKTDLLFFATSRANTQFGFSGLWPLALLPPVIILFVSVCYFNRQLFQNRRAIAIRLLLGFGLLVTAAGACDVVANFFWKKHALLYQIELIIEELGEMLGGTLILWAIRDLLISHGMRIVVLPDAESRAAKSTGDAIPRTAISSVPATGHGAIS